jgi:hypothetical protein
MRDPSDTAVLVRRHSLANYRDSSHLCVGGSSRLNGWTGRARGPEVVDRESPYDCPGSGNPHRRLEEQRAGDGQQAQHQRVTGTGVNERGGERDDPIDIRGVLSLDGVGGDVAAMAVRDDALAGVRMIGGGGAQPRRPAATERPAELNEASGAAAGAAPDRHPTSTAPASTTTAPVIAAHHGRPSWRKPGPLGSDARTGKDQCR